MEANSEIMPLEIHIEDFMTEQYRDRVKGRFYQLLQGEKLSSYEYELITCKGTSLPVEICSSLFTLNGKPSILCMIRDISIRKNFERTLTQVGIQIETQERRKLATDLHDHVGPLLSSMNMCISLFMRKNNMQEHEADLSDIRRILKESIAAVREISNNISPQVLTKYGVASALEMFFETKRKLIKIQFEHNIHEFRFSEIKEIMIYNIIKEAFNNTLKYAEASIVEISLRKNERYITVHYKDDGVGFNLEENLAAGTTSLGLFSIINRVKNLEGEYVITTSPGKGFLLDIVFSY